MAPKRKARDSDIPAEKPKRRPGETTGEEIIRNDGDNMNAMTCVCVCPKEKKEIFWLKLEGIIRRVVRKEIAAAQHQSPRLTPNLSGGIISGTKQFQLQFTNKLKPEYYTQTKIVAERDESIQIVLRDVESGAPVTEGPMSSLEIEICVLRGDFKVAHQNWRKRRKQFKANIIKKLREGRKALLKCDTSRITLKHGVASIPKIEFTDISKLVIGAGTFILAARSEEKNVREAISQPFKVKDKRGAPSGKLKKPSLDSEIWRLRHIAKGKEIYKQFSDDGIETVKDFLQRLTTNPSSLREKFGNISSGRWEEIVDNARACEIGDNEHYFYQATEGQLLLIFNPIYEVVYVSFDGQTLRLPKTFTSADEKRSVEAAKKEAYGNEKDFVLWKKDLEELLRTLQVGQSGTGIPPQQADLPAAAQQGQVFEWGPEPGKELTLSGNAPNQLTVNEPSMSTDAEQMVTEYMNQAPEERNMLDLLNSGNEPSMSTDAEQMVTEYMNQAPEECNVLDLLNSGNEPSMSTDAEQMLTEYMNQAPEECIMLDLLNSGNEPSMPYECNMLDLLNSGNEPSMPYECNMLDLLNSGNEPSMPYECNMLDLLNHG